MTVLASHVTQFEIKLELIRSGVCCVFIEYVW